MEMQDKLNQMEKHALVEDNIPMVAMKTQQGPQFKLKTIQPVLWLFHHLHPFKTLKSQHPLQMEILRTPQIPKKGVARVLHLQMQQLGRQPKLAPWQVMFESFFVKIAVESHCVAGGPE